MIIFGTSLKISLQKHPPLINMGPLMTRGIYIFLICMGLYGCTQFAASVGGTFVGNIASDKFIKSTEGKPAKVVDKSRGKK